MHRSGLASAAVAHIWTGTSRGSPARPSRSPIAKLPAIGCRVSTIAPRSAKRSYGTSPRAGLDHLRIGNPSCGEYRRRGANRGRRPLIGSSASQRSANCSSKPRQGNNPLINLLATSKKRRAERPDSLRAHCRPAPPRVSPPLKTRASAPPVPLGTTPPQPT